MTSAVYSFSFNEIGYQGVPVLAAQAISIPVAKWTCLVGPSGGGKTTLLKAILRLIPGLQQTSFPQAKISYMPHHDLLLPWKTVLENVLLGFYLRGQDFCQQQAEDVLKAVGLMAERHRYPYQLSTGMRQRVALARTLLEKADLILMDEPFSAVDVKTRQQLYELAVTQLKGRTVVFVSHDWGDIVCLAEHLIALKGQPAVCQSLHNLSYEFAQTLQQIKPPRLGYQKHLWDQTPGVWATLYA